VCCVNAVLVLSTLYYENGLNFAYVIEHSEDRASDVFL